MYVRLKILRPKKKKALRCAHLFDEIWWSKMAKRQWRKKEGNLIQDIFFNATKSTPSEGENKMKKWILSLPVVKFVMVFCIEGIWDRYLIKYFYDPYSKEVRQNAMLSAAANEIISICCAISNQRRRRRRQRKQRRHKMKIKRELGSVYAHFVKQIVIRYVSFVRPRACLISIRLYNLNIRERNEYGVRSPRGNCACKIFLYSAKYS